MRLFRVLSSGLSCPFARSRLQLTDLAFQFRDLLLLLFDCVKHGPEDRVVVNHQVAGGVFGHGFRNNFLQRLSSETDVFSLRVKTQRIVWLVLVAKQLQLLEGNPDLRARHGHAPG